MWNGLLVLEPASNILLAPVPKLSLAEVAVCEERIRNPASSVHIVCREVHDDTYPREKLHEHTNNARGDNVRCTKLATAYVAFKGTDQWAPQMGNIFGGPRSWEYLV